MIGRRSSTKGRPAYARNRKHANASAASHNELVRAFIWGPKLSVSSAGTQSIGSRIISSLGA
jgi:hypothetical protein